jgi:hypothetical protein
MASVMTSVGFLCALLACLLVNCPVTQNTHMDRVGIWSLSLSPATVAEQLHYTLR